MNSNVDEHLTDDSADDRPGYRSYRIFCDDSGLHGSTYYGFGSLWMASERRGDFYACISELRSAHRYNDEIKWTNIKPRNKDFYAALVDRFFHMRSLMFHCLLVRKGLVDKSFHGMKDPMDLARRKHFGMLVGAKIRWLAERDKKKAYHVITDRIPSRYAKADEAMEVVLQNQLRRLDGRSILTKVTTQDSKESYGIQLADVLLGAVMSEWNGEEPGPAKRTMRTHVAKYLGWSDLAADTHRAESKFNIWCFHDPTRGVPRDRPTRSVKLLIPMQVYRRG